jgi:hypothetical protein
MGKTAACSVSLAQIEEVSIHDGRECRVAINNASGSNFLNEEPKYRFLPF